PPASAPLSPPPSPSPLHGPTPHRYRRRRNLSVTAAAGRQQVRGWVAGVLRRCGVRRRIVGTRRAGCRVARTVGVGVICRRGVGLSPQEGNLGFEVIDALEVAIDAREPKVRDLVELAQWAEDREPDFG